MTAVMDTVVQIFAERAAHGTKTELPMGPLGALVTNDRGTVATTPFITAGEGAAGTEGLSNGQSGRHLYGSS